ncbi:DUF445 family protein [Vibrio sp. FNV 38]|nr:DUF445 family protein [Vibrio sp. FNV 38]
MNKNILTNATAIGFIAVGYLTQIQWILIAGVFAFSGAVTNSLAIHMLFEKIPGLYGSGVIPARFEEFKVAIRDMMMEQFFTEENIDRFLNDEMNSATALDLAPIIDKIDFNPTFDGLVDVIAQSSFGSMLAMFGGTEALQPLKQPFVEKMRESVADIGQSDTIKEALKEQFESKDMMDDIKANIEQIITQRLDELTPQLVKELVQKMIKQHLGWLVVWGGVFGGIIGLISGLFI